MAQQNDTPVQCTYQQVSRHVFCGVQWKRFYRAVLRLHVVTSVCLSVTLVDQEHIGWKAWKLIARTISPAPLLFVVQRQSPTPRGTWGNFEETSGGVGKIGVLEHKCGDISERRNEKKLPWRAHRNSLTLFRTVPFPTLYGLLFPKIGVRNPHPKLESLSSQEQVKLRTSNLAGIFTGSIRAKAH